MTRRGRVPGGSQPPAGLFPLGRLYATPRALEALAYAGEMPEHFLRRHMSGDWGDLAEDDRRANARALETRARIFSRYTTVLGERLWIITEADRSATTILRPDEY